MPDSKKPDDTPDKFFTKRPQTKITPKKPATKPVNKPTSAPVHKATSNATKPITKPVTQAHKPAPKPLAKHTPMPNKPPRFHWQGLQNVKNPRLPLAACGGVLVLFLFIVAWGFTHKNAYEVYVGDTLAGVIPMSKQVTEETIYNTAVAKLAAEVGTKVQVADKITFKAVHAAKKKMSKPESLISNLYKKWPYTVEASIITVDGVKLANLKSAADAQATLDRLAAQYVTDPATITATTFDKVEVVPEFIDPANVVSVDVAFAALATTTESTQAYTVKPGDSLGRIAANAATTLEKLLEANSGMTIETKLKIGEVVQVPVQKPLISVTTTERVTTTEAAPKEVEKRANPQQPASYSKVIQQGRDGEQTVTADLVRVNGVAGEPKIISTEIVSAPIKEIVEVGTKK